MNAIVAALGCPRGGIAFETALDRVLRLAPGMVTTETIGMPDAVGRVLAEPFLAASDLPRFNQSAMDGYAVRVADLTPGARLPVTGRSAAGEAPALLAAGGAHRILTGAPLPEGADAVIAQENTQPRGPLIEIAGLPDIGANIRHRGEDMRAGQALIAAGTVLDWRHIAVFAAQGAATVSVRRRPRVTLLSSGRELRAPGHSLAPGQIHDSNLPMLLALLQAGGAVVKPMPIVTDDASATRAALRRAALDADLVITTAGISVGDEDHVRDAVQGLGGDLAVLSVAMKPGKPLVAGRLGLAVFIGLPGNPMAALAGAMAFVQPLLARMTGLPPTPKLRARADFSLRRRPGRTDFIPVRLSQRDACLWAERVGPDGSGRLAPLLAATGLAFLAAQDADIGHGSVIGVLPLLPGAAALS